jgi:tRNA (cytidine/uridine-2'-O-)-methyltransferase|tara:strand:- start:242 stop:691 length:450 start_codon:yes stop_codon:yes gene_type:complete
MINIALFKPDIPQNTAAIIRLCACFKVKVHIIEPCGFNMEDARFKRVVMDYKKLTKIQKYKDFDSFIKKNSNSRIILITTKAKKNYHKFNFEINDMLLLGRESAGVTEEVHNCIKYKLKVPMQKKTRSLNVSITAAIVLSEALKQNNFF